VEARLRLPEEEEEEEAGGPPRGNVHPGPATNFAVTGLPEALRRFECATDWKERPEFERRPSAAVLALLDQISLGSLSLREPATLRGDALFPPPFEVEAVPWCALAAFARAFPAGEGLGLEILRDWGSILRSALSTVEPRRGKEQPQRSVLAQAYERATLRWMVQRLAFERLAASA
jgi:hypothetical protein